MSNSYDCPSCGTLVVGGQHHHNTLASRACEYFGWPVPSPAQLAAEREATLRLKAGVAAEVERMRIRELAREQIEADRVGGLAAGRAERAASLQAEMLDIAGLEAIEAPTPLVDGLLFRDSLARMNGPSGHGKSFVVLDIAACIATGTPWHGRAVSQGAVLYMAAEGAPGLGLRARAWQDHHRLKMAGVMFLPRPVQAVGDEWEALVSAVELLDPRPALIVVDTQARVTVGVEENSATEMGVMVDAMERLRVVTGACVLLVHHRGLNGENGRGSTAVRGALSTELDVTKLRAQVTVKVTKQKDAEEGKPFSLTLTAAHGSAVLVADGESVLSEDGVFVEPTRRADPQAARVLALVDVMIANLSEGNGATLSEIRALFFAHPEMQGLTKDVQRSAWHRAWGRLEKLGRVEKHYQYARYRFRSIAGLDPLAQAPPLLADGEWVLSENAAKTDTK